MGVWRGRGGGGACLDGSCTANRTAARRHWLQKSNALCRACPARSGSPHHTRPVQWQLWGPTCVACRRHCRAAPLVGVWAGQDPQSHCPPPLRRACTAPTPVAPILSPTPSLPSPLAPLTIRPSHPAFGSKARSTLFLQAVCCRGVQTKRVLLSIWLPAVRPRPPPFSHCAFRPGLRPRAAVAYPRAADGHGVHGGVCGWGRGAGSGPRPPASALLVCICASAGGRRSHGRGGKTAGAPPPPGGRPRRGGGRRPPPPPAPPRPPWRLWPWRRASR